MCLEAQDMRAYIHGVVLQVKSGGREVTRQWFLKGSDGEKDKNSCSQFSLSSSSWKGRGTVLTFYLEGVHELLVVCVSCILLAVTLCLTTNRAVCEIPIWMYFCLFSLSMLIILPSPFLTCSYMV